MRMRLKQDVEEEADGRRELTVEVFVHERRGSVAELHPAGAEWRVRWLRGTTDLNRQGSGSATVQVTAPGLYRVRSVASARRARDAYVEVTEADGALRATVLGLDEQVPRTTGPRCRSWKSDSASPQPGLHAPLSGVIRLMRARTSSRRAACTSSCRPWSSMVDGLEVPPLKAVSDKQLAYARAVRASAVQNFLSAMLARGAKLPRSNI